MRAVSIPFGCVLGIEFLIGRAVGWGNTPTEPSFGGSNDAASVKGKLVNLISSVRTLMRSGFALAIYFVSSMRRDVVGCLPCLSCGAESGTWEEHKEVLVLWGEAWFE